ncbi:MAG: thiamine pyrophosphate-requiring protein [Betaproteobacteria bacterium]|nr:thiamine pyrophosphate-requiring protein [Betaproteobacteria bacterium]
MAKTVSDALVERLTKWGVGRIYGYPGDGINGVVGAIQRQKKIEFIQPRHEEMAAFMACGHAKFTGELGVCLATSGPGAIHLLNGLYDAKVDHQPVLAIVGHTSRSVLGASYQQEVDLPSLFKDVASEYAQVVSSAVQLRHVVDRAIRTALGQRCPVCIVLPTDVQELENEEPPHKHGAVHSGIGYSAPRIVPSPPELERAAEILNAGKRVAMLVGAGALGATSEVLEVADALGAGVAKALLGKTVVSDALPFVTGGIGLLGTKPTYDMMMACDTLLVVGSSFPYSEFLPEEGQARGVQIDIDARMIGLRYPMEANLLGDSAETLRLLLPMLRPKADRSWRAKIEAGVRKWWGTLEERAMLAADPLSPQRLFHELSPRLPEDANLACDTGSAVFWYSRHLKLAPTMRSAHSGSLASMGAAMPYAISAKFAYPGQPVFAFVGDGAMQMNGLAELITVAKYWKRWPDPRFIVLVLNNRDLNMVSWEQRILQGNPKFRDSQDLPDFSYAAYARLLGFDALTVTDPDSVADAWDYALAQQRPVLVEAIVDPAVPMLPPHVTLEQAKSYLTAVLKGDPEAFRIIKASVKEVLA